MTLPRLLSPEILGDFEAQLRARRIGIVEAWAPGLTDAQIDKIIGPADLQLPEEARVWWRWHNGTRHGQAADRLAILPGRDLVGLQEAVGVYEAVGLGNQLLIPVGEKPLIHIACRASGEVAAPVCVAIRDFELGRPGSRRLPVLPPSRTQPALADTAAMSKSDPMLPSRYRDRVGVVYDHDQ